MSTSKPRTLHFAVGGALLAIGTLGVPIQAGCDLPGPATDEAAAVEAATAVAPAQTRETQPSNGNPIVVNPGPVAPPFPLRAEESGLPIIINPGPVPSPAPKPGT